MPVNDHEVAAKLEQFARAFDEKLATVLPPPANDGGRLVEAMRYALLAPGKRVRPYIVVKCCELLGGPAESAWPAAAAVECVHAFSLVHDDLPSMDNDDFRRGRATTHKVFGDALAILAGDALAVLAFEILARAAGRADRALAMLRELAEAAGRQGMIGGQADDLAGERQAPSLESTKAIHAAKTVRLFAASARLGAMSADAPKEMVELLGRFGTYLGEAFQIADDVLDATGGSAKLGKATGKDLAANKQTYPRCIGVEASREAAAVSIAQSLACLGSFGPAADDLRALAEFVAKRDY